MGRLLVVALRRSYQEEYEMVPQPGVASAQGQWLSAAETGFSESPGANPIRTVWPGGTPWERRDTRNSATGRTSAKCTKEFYYSDK
jgi:hypothetical protein